jgi:hypothetical protein
MWATQIIMQAGRQAGIMWATQIIMQASSQDIHSYRS